MYEKVVVKKRQCVVKRADSKNGERKFEYVLHNIVHVIQIEMIFMSIARSGANFFLESFYKCWQVFS